MTFIEENERADVYIADLLRRYGLESLAPWALEQQRVGRDSAQIVQLMRETPEFKFRFPAIEFRQLAGLPAISPAEYVTFEIQAAELMRRSNLPIGFYDSREDYTEFLKRDVSLGELQARVQEGYSRVTSTPPEVRATFRNWYGPDGDAALAAFFLDPDRAEPVLIEQARAATFGGMGAMAGLTVTESLSRLAAQAGVSGGDAQTGFGDLNSTGALYEETITEGQDLRAQEEGVKATFNLDSTSAEAVRKRREKRLADFSGNQGALTTQQGVVGLGTAGRQ